MTTTQDVARFMLARVTSPDDAAHFADVLGGDMTEVHPRACFPSYWVRARNAAAPDIAIYANSHCDDPDLLAEIAATAIAKVDVQLLDSLIENKYLREGSRQSIRNFMESLGTDQSGISGYIRSRVNQLVYHESHEIGCLAEVNELLDIEQTDPNLVDEILVHLNKVIPAGWIPKTYLATRFGLNRTPYYYPFWLRGQRSLTDTLALLDPGTRRVVIAELMAIITDLMAPQTSSERVSLEFTELIMNTLSSKDVSSPVKLNYRTRDTFSPEAIDLLMSSPEWRHLLLYQSLNPAQLAEFIDLNPLADAQAMLLLTHGNRECLDLITSKLPPDIIITDSRAADAVMRCLKDTSDPYFTWLLEHVAPEIIVSYLLNSYPLGSKRAMLGPKDVKALAARVSGEDFAQRQTELTMFFDQQRTKTDISYRQAVAEYFPGAFSVAIGNAEMADYVYERLTSSGADSDTIADQLVNVSDTSLSNLVNVLAAATRVR
jgi:hypothetical protein